MGDDRWISISLSAGAKKFISATAVADLGNSQAMYRSGSWPAEAGVGLEVANATLYNYSGSSATVGLGVRLSTSSWGAGTITAAGAYTDDTADAQSATTGDFAMHNRAESGSGHLIHASERFNCVTYVQSVAGDQTTPVLIVEEWTGAAWTNVAADLYVGDTLIGGSPGENVLVFPILPNWAKGGSGVGVRQDRYNVRVRFTTAAAGTADPVASQIFVGYVRHSLVGLADGQFYDLTRTASTIQFPAIGEALFPLFSIADQRNHVEAEVREWLK